MATKRRKTNDLKRDHAAEQLNNFKKHHKTHGLLTTGISSPVGSKASLSAGPHGPLLLQDFVFLDEITHFSRERIPERVVHSKGAGAFGYFEVTHDITKYCKAKVFEKIGKKTEVAVRFATNHGEKGSPDTLRDPRGFSVKFYTEDGTWDMVGLNMPIFFISDPIMFPDLVHSQKRNPVTNLQDADMVWDFLTLWPESINMVTWVFSDFGTPDGYRYMPGYSCHAFKMVNAKDESVYCKFNLMPDLGIKNLTRERARNLQLDEPDYATRDLYNAIAGGDFPSWSMSIQVMTLQQAKKNKFNPFDVTKEWAMKDYPPIPVGRLVLNRNPTNFFADVEQIAFSPSHLVMGIEPSPDKLLQGRLFAYSDAHRHRLGPNHLQIPVNCPFKKPTNHERDGEMCVTDNQDGAPNYFPNSFHCLHMDKKHLAPPFPVSGEVKRYEVDNKDNFSHATEFYKELGTEGQKNLINNVAQDLHKAQELLQKRAVELFNKVDQTFGHGVQKALKTLA